MSFTSRQAQILFLLINREKPIAQKALLENLQVSRRTLFRELRGINDELQKYHLVLNTRAREGLCIEGTAADKAVAKQVIDQLQSDAPKNREERHRELLKLLIVNSEIQKIFFYADQLLVSNATIINDLKMIEPWLAKWGVRLMRRRGAGVRLDYTEDQFRKMVLAYEQRYPEIILIDRRLEARIQRGLSDLLEKLVEQLTLASIRNLVHFLGIAVARIQAGHPLLAVQAEPLEPMMAETVTLVGERLSSVFGIGFPASEQAALGIFLKSAPRQQRSTEDWITIGHQPVSLREIIYEMLAVFDPETRFYMKTDETFVVGLMTHLRPAITRMIHDIPIQNALLQDIQDSYAVLFDRARAAAAILEKYLSKPVSEEEIGFLTLHFGGAIARQKDLSKKIRPVHVGVVCAHGIGIATLISSRLKAYFGPRVKVKVLSIQQLPLVQPSELDFIVSSFAVASEQIPIIEVAPILKAEDFKRVDEQIAIYAKREKKRDPVQKQDTDLYSLLDITKEIDGILTDFRMVHVAADVNFEQVIGQIGGMMGKTPKDSAAIVRDLKARETLDTQVIPEFQIAFFHCRTIGVVGSKMRVILPKGSKFTDSYFRQIRAIIVMLVDKRNMREVLAISKIGAAIFEDEKFLSAIHRGETQQVQFTIEKILNNYLQEKFEEVYER
jgi:mannitol operon transcriptional antiterminator